jgi:hypothetical protein
MARPSERFFEVTERSSKLWNACLLPGENMENHRKKVLRNVGLGLALVCLPAGAASIAFSNQVPTPELRGDSIRAASSYQDPALLKQAWQLPAARRFTGHFESQSNSSSCGPSTLANIERSFGEPSSEARILSGTGTCFFGVCLGGLTLDELSELARTRTQRRVRLLRDLTYDQFRDALRAANDPGRRIVINFNREPLFGEGHGHFSPLGGFLEDRELVFVLDVNAKYGPFLVDVRRLFEAIDTIDSSSGKKRGLLVLEAS